MYCIRYDRLARILHMRLEGFWSVSTLSRFTAELLFETTNLRLRGVRFGVLSDSTDFSIQSSLVAQGFQRLMEKGAAMHKGPTAIIVAGHLNKIQAERTLKGERVRIFLSEPDARAWLADEL